MNQRPVSRHCEPPQAAWQSTASGNTPLVVYTLASRWIATADEASLAKASVGNEQLAMSAVGSWSASSLRLPSDYAAKHFDTEQPQ